MNKFEDFTGLYPLSKTLRFELKPIGRTLEHIETDGLLEQDQHRAESYKKVKKIIDRYHKDYIENALGDFELQLQDKGRKNSLEEYYALYQCKRTEEEEKNAFTKVQKNLRKQISDRLTDLDVYKRIFKKELIKEDLLEYVTDTAEKELVEEFRDFTTYFSGFHENRKNMYSDEDKSTAISYRIIHENLPKFIDNGFSISKIIAIPEMQNHMKELYKDFEAYLNVESLTDLFRLDNFSMVITQTQIEVYNTIIGGKSEDKVKIKGLNEYINLYNQTHKENKLPKLKVLFKQILSDREAISWLPDEFKSDQETLDAIQKCYSDLNNESGVLGERNLKTILESLAQYDLNGINIRNDLQLTDISQKVFGSWSVIQNAVLEDLKNRCTRKRKEDEEEYEQRLLKLYKAQGSFSIGYLDECLVQAGQGKKVEDYFATLGAVNTETEQRENLFARIENAYTMVADLLSKPYPNNKNLAQDKSNVTLVKDFLDSLKALQRFIKPLLGHGDENEKDERFYGEFTALWSELDKVTSLYNMARNYMTRKPYSVEKIKLNFENSTLMDGWDLNKEHDNTTIILRKDGLYYLAIMNKKANKILDVDKAEKNGDCYERMVYKLLPGANKMLPKVFFAKSRIEEFAPSQKILNIRKQETFKKGPKFSIDDCHALIDFFKSSIAKHEDWRKFGFKFSDTSIYEDLSGFYREVESQGYNISFTNVSVSYINKMVDEGKLYLFQIYNKDFSPFSKGTPNMHTLYWKMLFDETNLKDVVYKLNGQAEAFFRKKSISYQKPTHPANLPIKNKNQNNPKKESVFEYDLVKNRRYTVDKFQFHVPITMNFKSIGRDHINHQVMEFLQSDKDAHIIGIDRGERHLLYLVVMDRFGNIKEQFSLNEIVNQYKGVTYHTNYRDLLEKKESQREGARKSWQTIENIKELKEGYLSQVIHKITELMLKYHAIVVLEDLNMGFMRGRQKVEKQVYQKFEKMMIEKINTLQGDWKKPWFTEGSLKWPKNLSSREYNGMNALMLTFQAEKKGYKLPVWCTFDRVVGLNFNKDKEGKRSPVTDKNGEELPHVGVNKGEKSFPVFITTFTCIEKDTKKKIKYDDYKLLSDEEKKNVNVYPKLNVYNVFNVSQTNLQEARPELYAKLEEQNQLARPELRGEENSFEPLDKMIKDQSWICPIKLVHQDNTFYCISKNEITLPEKSQFVDAESFAGTAFHEAIHSTGAENQLGRLKPEDGFGSAEYAREELVAELGSALVAQRYGLVKHVKEDSAAYLKSWLDSLKESPDFIKTTLVDVKKASSILTLKLDAIAEELAQQKNEQQDESNKNAVTPAKEPVYYASVQYLQLPSDTKPFDKLTTEQMLQEARNYDNGDAINLDFTQKSPKLHRGDTIAAEDENYAVVYNGTVGGTYNILRKVSEQEVKDNITRYGIDSDTSADVKAVACNMVADEFEKMTRDRMPVIEMPNGNVLHIQYNQEKDTLDVGAVTNTGLNVMHSFPYDHDFSLDSNLEGVNEKLTEMLVYQAEIETKPDYYVAELAEPQAQGKPDPNENREALDNFMTDVYWAARRDNGFRMDGFENYQGKQCLKLDNSDVQGSSYYLVSRQPADATKGETLDKFFMHLYDPDTQKEVFTSREMPHDRDSAYSFMRGGFRELEDYESGKQQDNQEDAEEEHHFRRGR